MSSMMTDVMKKACDARRSLGLDEHEPLDIARVLRLVEGITLVRRPFEGNISGCFVRGKTAKMIVINSARSLGHQNFTMAHEYYHLVCEPGLTGSVCVAEEFGSRPVSEAKADDFAGNFLVPREALAEAVYRLSRSRNQPLKMGDLIELEQLFGVSHKAMRVRLKQLGYLTAAQSDNLKDGVTREARALGFDVSLYSPTNDIKIQSPYPRLAREVLERGLISSGKYREMMLEGGFFDLIFGQDEEECGRAHESQPS
jgi:Zn-dependent peptidase ImmA (M78 family)